MVSREVGLPDRLLEEDKASAKGSEYEIQYHGYELDTAINRCDSTFRGTVLQVVRHD